jgi:hypothetical protein
LHYTLISRPTNETFLKCVARGEMVIWSSMLSSEEAKYYLKKKQKHRSGVFGLFSLFKPFVKF